MEWTEVFGYALIIVMTGFCVLGYVRKRMDLKDALGALREIRGLALYAMKDGRLSDEEKDEIIDRVASVAKRFV